jgi:hypothetical protein
MVILYSQNQKKIKKKSLKIDIICWSLRVRILYLPTSSCSIRESMNLILYIFNELSCNRSAFTLLSLSLMRRSLVYADSEASLSFIKLTLILLPRLAMNEQQLKMKKILKKITPTRPYSHGKCIALYFSFLADFAFSLSLSLFIFLIFFFC